MGTAVPVAVVLVGCCVNVVFLELIISEDKGAGNLITFAQFLFIAAEGLIFTVDFGRKRPKVPLLMYGGLVMLFFSSSVINNWSLKFSIPMPLHMVFKAGSLVTNMIMGMMILGKRYNRTKYVSVAMVTLGIYICTSASVMDAQKTNETNKQSEGHSQDHFTLLIGVGMVVLSLIIASGLGIFQEKLYRTYGKHSKEAMFYTHAMSLPFFVLLVSDIGDHVTVFNNSETVVVAAVLPTIPKMWLFLLGNVMTQYVCVRTVFLLTSECSSLTVTLVITLRKFLSLIFSVIYFRNPFTIYHWIGSVFTFTGSLLFTGLHVTLMVQLGLMKPEEEKTSVDSDAVMVREVTKIEEETREPGIRKRQQVASGSN